MNPMLPRLVGWLGALSLVPVLLWLILIRVPQASRDLQTARQQVEQERQRLAVTWQDVDDQFTREQERYARILRRFPWLAEPSEGTAFLTRLGNVVTGLSLKVMAIGAVQREATLHLEKLGRQIRLAGRFADNLRLVENVEQHKGFVEELRLQRLQPQGGAAGGEEIEAQFRLSSVELTPDVRQHLRALVGTLPDGAKPEPAEPDGALLSMPAQANPTYMASLRDPFILPGAIRKQAPQVEAAAAPASPELPHFMLAGIIESTTGRTAIINRRMVKEGERVEGILVEAIRSPEVVLRSPIGIKRITLPAFGATPPLH